MKIPFIIIIIIFFFVELLRYDQLDQLIVRLYHCVKIVFFKFIAMFIRNLLNLK